MDGFNSEPELPISVERPVPPANADKKPGARFLSRAQATGHRLSGTPFDSSHDKGQTDTTVFEDSGGRLGFKCLHNRCQGHDWHSARERLEAMAG